MQRLLSGIDRGRTGESAALLCSVLLAALVLWLLVRLVWLLVPRGDTAIDTAPARVAGAAAGAVPAQSIAKWHLFGNTPLRPGAGPNAPATTLALILRGTLAESDPKTGIAVIADGPNGERAFRVGDEVTSGARLSAVYPDHIVLVHEGVEETLKLPRDQRLIQGDGARGATAAGMGKPVQNPLSAAGAPRPPIGSAAASDGGTKVAAPADWQDTLARLRQNPDELARRVQVTPVLDGGKLSGVRISAAGDAALMTQLGLRSGDVVTSVNGMPVDSVARGEQIMASLKSSAAVRVTVQRDGKPVDLTIGLQ